MNDVTDALSRSPAWFPHAIDLHHDALSFVRLSRTDYERASFLDERILTPLSERQSIPWAKVSASIASLGLTERCSFIFHIGHVGSTLLSRLIGAHAGVFSLREPQVLRNFARLQSETETRPSAWQGDALQTRLGDCLTLLSRTFDTLEIPVIKATSFVSEMAAGLLSRPSAPKAMLMYVSPESYLATILGGPNSRKETAVLLPSRLRRLHARIDRPEWRPGSLSEGESVALGWACEMSALAVAASSAGGRAWWMDFDRFLEDPAMILQKALMHFGIDATTAQVAAILRGPDMRRYSKAPEHAYDAALRYAVLSDARAVHGEEIRRGLIWLERAAAEHAAIRDAMQRSNAEVFP